MIMTVWSKMELDNRLLSILTRVYIYLFKQVSKKSVFSSRGQSSLSLSLSFLNKACFFSALHIHSQLSKDLRFGSCKSSFILAEEWSKFAKFISYPNHDCIMTAPFTFFLFFCLCLFKICFFRTFYKHQVNVHVSCLLISSLYTK